ncbi:MAG TPA: Ger(x)C family spore germination protein [Syntrophomonadaceae bacterium]|nr:Ger(x)C family spore germination protein [Syntrophomonadaceae bacterium]
MRRLLIISSLIALLFSCSGCWEQKELNTTAIVTAWGVDLSVKQNGYLDFSAQLAQPGQPGESGQIRAGNLVLTGTGLSITESARRIMLRLPRLPLWAQASTCILGENLALQDLTGFYNFAVRNRVIRPDTNLLIAKNATPARILNTTMPLVSNSGRAFVVMEETQEKQLGIYVPVSLNDFLIDAATPGIEPAVPQVTLVANPENPVNKISQQENNQSQPGEKLILSGTAVFKGTKMVGSLDETESRGYRWLNSRIHKGGLITMSSPLNPGETISLEIIEFSSSSQPEFNQGQITMKIEVSTGLTFYEEDGTSPILTPETRSLLQKQAAQEIQREITACISKSQSLNSDILGWGRTIYQNQPHQWERLSPTWYQTFPHINSQIDVQVRVVRAGLDPKIFQFKE